MTHATRLDDPAAEFQSPRGDFGFLKLIVTYADAPIEFVIKFQSPRGDFGFLKLLQQ